jgi:hypothetical protein
MYDVRSIFVSKTRAVLITRFCFSDSPHCSHSSCSGCSGSEGSESRGSSSDAETEIPPQPPPPLPSKSAVGQSHNNSPGRQPGEKQKVKFSDTVTHILVPVRTVLMCLACI